MSTQKATIKPPDTPEAALRSAYFSLFHEMQFRCTKNSLMNYKQAEILQKSGDKWKKVTAFFTAASTTGVLASLLQKGKMLASKIGMAGLAGLPICGIMQLVGSSTSEFVPSYFERARKHACAAAGWMQLAESAREMQLRMKMDQNYDIEKLISQYGEMVHRKEAISKEVLVPRHTHKRLQGNTEMVYLAMVKRNNIYQEFLDLEVKNKNSVVQIQNAEDIYF